MKIIDFDEVKKLKSVIIKLQKSSRNEAVEFIKERYSKDGFDFHRLFLHSGLIFAFRPFELNKILSGMNTVIDRDTKIKEDLDFLIFLISRKKDYEEQIAHLINSTEESISIESIFSYLEFLRYRIYNHMEPLNGIFRNADEIEVHFDHILSCFNEIVELIRKNEVPSTNLEKYSFSEEFYNKLFYLISRRKATQEKIYSLLLEITDVKRVKNYEFNNMVIENLYITEYYIPFWRKFEIYRDLNLTLFFQELTQEEELSLLRSSGAFKTFSSDFIHLDMSKELDFNVDVDIYQASKFLEPIYGDQDNVFVYKDSDYTIKMLLDSYKSLLKINYQQLKKADEGQQCTVLILEEEELLELAHIEHPQLLQLLSVNMADPDEPSTLMNYKPLIRNERKYYFVPSHFENIAVERCIDKILSNSHVTIRTEKGKYFEDQVEQFFNSMKLKYARVSRDERNGIPEIDGMFVLDEYVFIFEAKAMIKPENIIEASDCFESKACKAFAQIKERFNIFMDEEKRRLIEEKTNISLRGKTIAPFILMNHVFFNGYEGLLFSQDDGMRHIPIIDFLTLKRLLMTSSFPTWKYNKKRNAYKLCIKQYSSTKQLYDYMMNQLNALVASEETIYQLNEDYVLSPIARSVRITQS